MTHFLSERQRKIKPLSGNEAGCLVSYSSEKIYSLLTHYNTTDQECPGFRGSWFGCVGKCHFEDWYPPGCHWQVWRLQMGSWVTKLSLVPPLLGWLIETWGKDQFMNSFPFFSCHFHKNQTHLSSAGTWQSLFLPASWIHCLHQFLPPPPPALYFFPSVAERRQLKKFILQMDISFSILNNFLYVN